ncbi:unnamed protein product, partial [Staurois parvus]
MILPTDTNDVALFLPLTLMMGHYSSDNDTNDGAPIPSLVSVGGIAPHLWNTILKYHTILKSNLM